MRRLVFCDFDGVLNSAAYKKRRPPMPDGEGLRLAWKFDARAVSLLAHICNRGGAELVLTSIWRNDFPMEMMDAALRLRGYLMGRQIFRTPELPRPPTDSRFLFAMSRPDEIRSFLGSKSEDRFVIFDDEEWNWGDLRPRVVQTDYSVGLVDQHVEVALKILETA